MEIARELTPRLVPRYIAFTVKYFLPADPEEVEIVERLLSPDVGISEAAPTPVVPRAGAMASPSVELDTLVSIPIPHVAIEIRDSKNRRLITAIELLSPTNKSGQGRRKYLRKRRKILLSQTHLLEIDLLRMGKRVPMKHELPHGDYFVFLSRAGRRPKTNVWPISLQQPLPTVTIPLLPGDADLELDLQKVLSSVYDAFGLAYAIDYSLPPDVSLSPEYAGWADRLLRAAEKRN